MEVEVKVGGLGASIRLLFQKGRKATLKKGKAYL